LFPILLFQREDLFRLIMFLLRPKPPRLRKARMEMMPKIRLKELVRLRHLLLHIPKNLAFEELLSSSTSSPKNAAGEASAPDDDVEIFDLLDS
jgi:hypothetical protein